MLNLKNGTYMAKINGKETNVVAKKKFDVLSV